MPTGPSDELPNNMRSLFCTPFTGPRRHAILFLGCSDLLLLIQGRFRFARAGQLGDMPDFFRRMLVRGPVRGMQGVLELQMLYALDLLLFPNPRVAPSERPAQAWGEKDRSNTKLKAARPKGKRCGNNKKRRERRESTLHANRAERRAVQ